MIDPRLAKLADVVVNYSLGVKKGQLVAIQIPAAAAGFAEECVRAVLQTGAHPSVRLIPDGLAEVMLEHGSDEQLKFTNPLWLQEAQSVDARIAVWSETNTKGLSGFSPSKAALMAQGRKPILEAVLGRAAKGELNWVGTLIPTPAHAQDAEMSTRAYEDFVFKAGLLDHPDPAASWRKLGDAQQQLVDYLHERMEQGKTEYRVTAANGTDLVMSLAGKKWINCDGKRNFPDGEVFTGPEPTSVNGKIRYSFPAVYQGRECDGVELTFRDGKVVEARADKGEEFLLAMLDQDEGARYIGEAAIGTNYGITRHTKNTLFDEKIGGTIHFAVGKGYPETGNTNDSGLHWDMVCDLRPGGQITLGGEVVSENGRFLKEGFPRAE